MDLYKQWERLREQQDYFDRMREMRNDLEWRLKQDAVTRELEKSVLDAKATGMARRELGEDICPRGVNATELVEALWDEIWQRHQEVLALIQKSDLPFPRKEHWIRRLNSEDWRTELKVLEREVTIDRNAPASLRKIFNVDLYNPSTLTTAEWNLNRLGAALCLLNSSLLKWRLLLEGM